MGARPRIKLVLTTTDNILELIGWIAILAIWMVVIINYFKLPDTIPIHFNALGEADGFGSKVHIWILPVVATVLFVGMTILNKFPHVLNYPVEITQDNAEDQYTFATRLMRFLKLAIVLIIGFIVCKTVF